MGQIFLHGEADSHSREEKKLCFGISRISFLLAITKTNEKDHNPVYDMVQLWAPCFEDAVLGKAGRFRVSWGKRQS